MLVRRVGNSLAFFGFGVERCVKVISKMLGYHIKTKCLRRLGVVGSPRTGGGSGGGYIRRGHDYAGDCGGNKGGSMAESVESVAGRRDNNNDGGVVVVLADVRVWVWCGGRRRFIGILMDVQPSPQKEGDSF